LDIKAFDFLIPAQKNYHELRAGTIGIHASHAADSYGVNKIKNIYLSKRLL